MNNALRNFIFTHYWLITLFLLLIALPMTIYTSKDGSLPTNLATVCGATLGLVYFVQKQRIEDIQVFERLFTSFNSRYGAMNENLQRIVAGRPLVDCEPGDVLDDYFNLCAEEYLFYQQGHILQSVWRSWCRGIETYLQSPTIESYFNIEIQRDTHYGLTREVIRRYAV